MCLLYLTVCSRPFEIIFRPKWQILAPVALLTLEIRLVSSFAAIATKPSVDLPIIYTGGFTSTAGKKNGLKLGLIFGIRA